jgi:tRNA pseudouridine55 synthase
LGKYLGGSAILHELRRTKMNEYDLADAKTIDEVSENDIIKITDFFDLPKVNVDDYMVRLVKNGIELDERQTNLSGIFYVVNNCDIIAIYEEVSHLKYKPILIFK